MSLPKIPHPQEIYATMASWKQSMDQHPQTILYQKRHHWVDNQHTPQIHQ